jgi:Domain of unknown function (DUF6431)
MSTGAMGDGLRAGVGGGEAGRKREADPRIPLPSCRGPALTSSVLIVGVPPREVECMLVSGRGPELPAGARCPDCDGVLRGFWRGYARSVRLGRHVVRLEIARSVCRGCRRTHALLPSLCVPRRLDAAPGVYLALALAARGRGHRPIALRLGLPATTVRGWLRTLRRGAPALVVRLWQLADGLGHRPGRAPPVAGTLGELRRALSAVNAAARRRLGPAGHAGRAGLLASVMSRGALAHTDSP